VELIDDTIILKGISFLCIFGRPYALDNKQSLIFNL